tara:strand:- start:3027 stop:6128 length:3102 start_codon:yes stop_codon:yes gene_type:complete
MQRVHLDPVVFDLSGLTEGDLDQLTFYMFVYDAAFAAPGDNFDLPEISLVTGMSVARTATVIGNRYVWPTIMSSNPLRGPGPQLENGDYANMITISAPQARMFQRIDLSPQSVFIERVNSVFDKVYGTLSKTILDSKPEIRKIIKKDNYFSDFWISKDSDENNRFMFAFDIESCLVKNSYFPFLYRSKKISSQMINGTGLMTDSDPSRVLRMNMIRRFVSKDAQRDINDLGTSGRSVETGPDTTFPEKVVGEATPVSDIYLTPERVDGVRNKIIFYEGKDQFAKFQKYGGHKGSQINGDFVYGAEYVVYDSAPIFMRNMIKYLLARKSTVSDIFDTIVNSVPTPGGYSGGVVSNGRDLYDPKRMTLNVPLSRIKGIIDGEAEMFDTALLRAAFEYQELLDDLNPFAFEGDRINIAVFFREEFNKNNGLIDPLVIRDLEKLMDVGIQIIYRKLTEIFPNDPLGRGLAFDQDSRLQRRGFCQRKVPLITDRTIFSRPVPKGESFKNGTDYIFNREPNREQFGLSRISLADYENRVQIEFEKYFQSNDDSDISPIESYLDPAYAYMTSRVIRTPGRDTMNIPSPGGGSRPIIRYNLNRYAQLFADISNMKFSVDNRQINPVIVDRDPGQIPNNILYDSVMKALEEQHCVEFSSTPTPQYNPPKVSTGKFAPTTENTSPDSGMFIFRNGPPAIPSLIGGANNTDPIVLTYMDNVNSSLSNTSAEKRPGSEDAQREERRLLERPIKLPFAIFGELTVDKDIDKRFIRYEDIPFNSLKEFVNMIGLTDASLRAVLQDTPVANLPNQVKSAMIIATTQQLNRFGNETVQFDACRPILSDHDSGETSREENMLISFSKTGPDEPPYPATYDPTKIYAKFLTFWLNYKQIARIEYLDGFKNLESEEEFSADVLTVSPVDNSRFEKTKLPEWVVLSRGKVEEALKNEQNLLCRVRLMSPLDYIKILSHYKKPVLDLVQEYFERKETLELPMYNEYFLLGFAEEVDQPEENPEKYPEGYFDDPEIEIEKEQPTYGFVAGYKGPM